MPDDKKLKEIQSRVKNYVSDGIIKTRGNKEFVDFFVNNSRDSLNEQLSLIIEIRKMIETD